MGRNCAERMVQAFTLIELVLIIFVLILVVVAIIPGLRAAKRAALRRDCINNLKQVGLAYRTWPPGSTDEFPQSVAVTNGGSKEWLAAGRLFLHYRTMSNELTTPKILVCPADNLKVPATSFGAGFSDTNSTTL